MLVTCVLTFGLGSLLTTTATSVGELTAFRVFTGFGMGGAMPNAIALTSEYMPKRSRTSVVMTMFCGFSFGSACAGWVAAAVIRRFGWQAVFLVGGPTPLVLAILLIAVLPESIRFLVLKGGSRRESPAISRASRQAADAGHVIAGEDDHQAVVFRQRIVRGRPRERHTAAVDDVLHEPAQSVVPEQLAAVDPERRRHQIEAASLITSLFQIGGLVGSLALAAVWGRRLSFGLLATIYLAAAVFILLIGEAGTSVPLLVVAVFASGVAVIGGQTASNALAAELYPTTIRSTGVGWALGVGRVGSILGPILGGVLLSYGGGARRTFWAAAAPALIATSAACAMAAIPVKRNSTQDDP